MSETVVIGVVSGASALIGAALGPVLSRRWALTDNERQLRHEFAKTLLDDYRKWVVLDQEKLQRVRMEGGTWIVRPPDLDIELRSPGAADAIEEYVRAHAIIGRFRYSEVTRSLDAGQYVAYDPNVFARHDRRVHRVISAWSRRNLLWPSWRLRAAAALSTRELRNTIKELHRAMDAAQETSPPE